ncbi:MAG TPA: hypothetical protein VHP33_04870 [Polyangiaceae bacterium]|nr:hypothetical protein [Polyangiaceae bacterium]
MLRRASKALSLLLLTAMGCSKPSTTGAAPSKSASVSLSGGASLGGASRLVSNDELSSPSAFELVARPDGLRLLWASAKQGPGWLFEADLAQDGSARGAARSVAVPTRMLGKVTDLAATSVGEQLALAWVEQGQAEARAMGTVVAGAAAPVLLDLGAAAVSAESARGNLVIAPEVAQERALVMWRGLAAPCVQSQAPDCVGFDFQRLRVGAAEKTGLPLSVPVPCASHSVELAVSAGRFHYGVCTREGADPVTTMFTIQYQPEYARAEPLLKGCLPLGTVDVEGRPWLVGDCHGKRKAVPVPLNDEQVQPDYIDALQISCTPERAELRQGRFVLTLREPRGNLEAVLPPPFLPTGARAGWTGKSLIVAYLAVSRLTTRSYACRAGTLQPL